MDHVVLTVATVPSSRASSVISEHWHSSEQGASGLFVEGSEESNGKEASPVFRAAQPPAQPVMAVGPDAVVRSWLSITTLPKPMQQHHIGASMIATNAVNAKVVWVLWAMRTFNYTPSTAWGETAFVPAITCLTGTKGQLFP